MTTQILEKTEPYKTASGIWQHPVLLKEAIEHKRTSGDPAWVALHYHAQMTKWIDDNVCKHCNDNVGDRTCYCMRDE